MNTQPTLSDHQRGFTIIEVIITLAVVSVLLTVIFQSYLVLESQRVATVRQARSVEIAYSNLRKVISRSSINNLCQASGGTDLLATGSPSGYTAYPDITKTLGTGSGQQIMIYPTAGCDTGGIFPNGNPIRVESKVWFLRNSQRTESVHASLIQ